MESYEYMDPSRLALFGALYGCAGWIAGLLLLAVGFVTVRKALPNAGYMVGGAGALQLLASCCESWQGPVTMWFGVDVPPIAYTLSMVVWFLSELGIAALIIGGAVMLAKAVPAAPMGGAS